MIESLVTLYHSSVQLSTIVKLFVMRICFSIEIPYGKESLTFTSATVSLRSTQTLKHFPVKLLMEMRNGFRSIIPRLETFPLMITL